MTEIFLQNLHMLFNDIFKYQFHNIKSKNKEFINRIVAKKYFTNSDIMSYGLITVIHTFGHDLK